MAGAGPGRYRFLVRAALASGVTGEPARVEFTVLAPLWRRGWFLALAVGAAAAAVSRHIDREYANRNVQSGAVSGVLRRSARYNEAWTIGHGEAVGRAVSSVCTKTTEPSTGRSGPPSPGTSGWPSSGTWR